MGRPATDTRQRLISAAIQTFQADGYARTSLAAVAQTAGTPKGNIYYYFKTKDDLALAVVDEWCRLVSGYLALLEQLPDPRQRLEGFIDQAPLLSGMYVTLGCPLAGLARDLRLEGGPLASRAGRVYVLQFDWLRTQLTVAGFNALEASSYARRLLTAYHGAILLTHALSDATWIDEESTHLKGWLGALFGTLPSL